MQEARGEPFFQTPPPHVPLRRVRSTLLVASVKMVRTMGRIDDYLAALPRERHGEALGAVAGAWVGVDLALAHYAACEALGLTEQAQIEVGRTVGEQIRGTIGGAFVAMTREAGVTPWTTFPAFPRIWSRVFDGSAIQGWKVGPKEVLVEATGLPLAEIRYFRNALRGQIMGVLDLFCTRSYVVPRSAPPGRWSMRVQ